MTTVTYRAKASLSSMVARLAGDAPISAFLEIADRCNEVCVHCYQVQGEKGELPLERIKSILDELADMGVLFLTLSGGEPTLRPDFLDIVRHARARAFAVKIYTNGITMTQALAEELASLAVQEVQTSLYSPKPEVHDWVTRVPGSFEKTTNAVRFLRAVGIAVVVKSPVMRMNEDDIDAWRELVVSLGADYAVDPTLDPREDGDRTPDGLRISDEAFLKLYRDPSFFGNLRKNAPVKNLERSVCGACSGSVHMEANGELRPCTQLVVPIGNVASGSVRDAWLDNPAASAIKQLTWKDLHGCRDCDLQPYCGRCFATSLSESGDALGPYPDACRRARLGYEAVHHVRPVITASSSSHDVTLGPYRKVAEGALETVQDVRTEEDEARALALGWTRGPRVAPLEPWYRPGELVQIRRPGKRPKGESLPSVTVRQAE